jgi:hypothetical protein
LRWPRPIPLYPGLPPDDALLLLDGIQNGSDPYDIVGTMELRDDEWVHFVLLKLQEISRLAGNPRYVDRS